MSPSPAPPRPVAFLIDVEPDGFFVDPGARVPWTGFERAVTLFEAARPALARATGRPARFGWFLRLDPQIEAVYGDPAWPLCRYAREIDRLRAAGDEIGLHVHAYRLDATGTDWVEDYGDPEWVSTCIRTAHRAYALGLGAPPRAFSTGANWIGAASVAEAAALGLALDCSPTPGAPTTPFRDPRQRGRRMDLRGMPRRPYRCAPGDLRRPAPGRRQGDDGLRILPQSRVRPARLARRLRRGWRRLRGHPPRRLRTGKLLAFCPAPELAWQLDRLASGRVPYLTLAMATRATLRPEAAAALETNLAALAHAPQTRRLSFATPIEVARACR